MKIRIILILLLFPVICSAQVKSTIDFIFGVEHSNRVLKTDSDEYFMNIIMDSRKGESGKINFRVGFNYNQPLANKVYLKSGIRLASVGYKGEKKTGLIFPSEIDPTSGVQNDPNLPNEIQFFYDYWFIEIPIIGRYEFNNKKFSPFIEAGISPNIYITSKTKSITDINSSTNFSDQTNSSFNRLNFSANISFGVNYHLSPKWIMFGQPIFRYHFTKLVDAPIKEYLYNFGIEFGARMKIK